MSRDPLAVFTQIGRLVDERWRAHDYDDRAFPEIAAAMLAETAPGRHVTADDLLRWTLATDVLPQQFDPESSFGQPPLTMFHGPRFVVDALFWMDGAPEIHQHGFSGAFHVLAGASLHTRYRFTLTERVSAQLLLGELALVDHELLGAGDTRTIESGDRLIHGLFHLERPSVSVVVRTLRDTDAGTQYRYLPSMPAAATALAEDPFFRDPLLKRRLEALSVLHALDPARCDAEVATLFARADFYTVFRVARDHLGRIEDLDRLRELLEHARPRHGARVDVLPVVFDEVARVRTIVETRRTLTGADQRFFLALLLSLPTRRAIVDAIAARFPGDDPVDRAIAWIGDLVEALGIPPGEDHTLVVLGELLRGHKGEALVERLKAEFDEDTVEHLRPQIAELEARLARAWLLRPLFA